MSGCGRACVALSHPITATGRWARAAIEAVTPLPHPPRRSTPSPIAHLRARYGDRLTGIVAALVLEAALLILLFTLGYGSQPGQPDGPALSTFDVSDPAPAPEEPQPDEPQPQQPQVKAPAATSPTPVVQPAPIAPAPAQPAFALAPPNTPAPAPAPAPRPTTPPAASARVYGPPNIGGPTSTDTPRVGTAPNGEPMYAARWYREPTRDELAGYLSTAQPGWGLIACKTAPDYRVEDCVPIGETAGSQLGRAVLAAAWQFKVRPPRIGGRDRIGEWVRIRIDYTQQGR